MASGPITSWQIDGETMETVTDFIFWGSQITVDGNCNHLIKRCLLLGRKVMTNLDSILKSRDITLPRKLCIVKAMIFPVVMYACESWTIKKSCALKNWCFWTVGLEKILESPLGSKEIQPVNPKGNQSWIFIGRIDAEAETPILWPPDVKSWLIWKDPDDGKDWRQEKRGLNGNTDLMDMSLSKPQELVMDREARRAAVHGSQRVGHNWANELKFKNEFHTHTKNHILNLQNSTILNYWLAGKSRWWITPTQDLHTIYQALF